MALYKKGENKIGYKITVWSSTGKTTAHNPWSEGKPLLTTKIRSKLISQLPITALKTLVGGGLGVTAMFAAVGSVGGAFGSTVSAVLMKMFDQALLRDAILTFSRKKTSIGVTLAGDFKASYQINTIRDLNALPGLLSIIPATFKVKNKPYWMGREIIKLLVKEQTGACIKGGNINIRYTIDV